MPTTSPVAAKSKPNSKQEALAEKRVLQILELSAAGSTFGEIAVSLNMGHRELLEFCQRMTIASVKCARCGRRSDQDPHRGGKVSQAHAFEPVILKRPKKAAG